MRLELQGISAGYGDTPVLRDVDLIVPSGKVVALLGPNGAGKTTALGVASGLVAPMSGRVLVDRVDLSDANPERFVTAGVCHITEGRSIFSALTVEENLRMFAPPGKEQESMARAVDAFPRLGERMRQVAGSMSGGEQQMLALARSYVSDSPIVLLDEVSLGLAPIVVDQIFEFVRHLAAGGHSLLLVEQYVHKVLDLADLVYVLVGGRVVFVGEPAEVDGGALIAQYLGAEI